MSNQDQPQRQVLRIHGRDHLPGGSDPIDPPALYFDFDNEGGWLYLVTNDFSPISPGDQGIVLWDTSGGDILLGAGAVVGTPGSTIEVSEANGVLMRGTTQTAVALEVGTSFTVYDSLSNPIFRVDEDGSVHIKTGGTIVADL